MKMKFKIFVICFGIISSIFVSAQEPMHYDTVPVSEEIELSMDDSELIDTLNVLDQRVTMLEDALFSSSKLKISGYIQAQWQSSEIDSLGNGSQDLKVGGKKTASELATMNRLGIRRGRVKFDYKDNDCQGVLQFEITEKGVTLKDAYLAILDPWVGVMSFKAGVFDRPFGYEISYSSSRRESPERSRIFQNLFPDERDMGGMMIFQAPKTSPWSALKLEAGLFAGNGIYMDTDSKKDFIGHFSYSKSITSDLKLGLGASYYEGFVAQTNANVYSMASGAFVLNSDASNKNKFAQRQYIGFDGQLSMNSVIGLSTIRGEYIFGTQPGTSGSSCSPKSGAKVLDLTANEDTYLRNLAGGSVYFIHDIATTKHSIVVKYDWYDPNTSTSASQIGKSGSGTGKADVLFSTIGIGYMYRMNANVRITAYYDMVKNEKVDVLSEALKGYSRDLADNLLTIRLQYKF
jgi:hypothetical protein